MIRHLLQIRPLLRQLLLVGFLFAPLSIQTHAQALPNLAPLNVNLSAYSATRNGFIRIAFTMTNSSSVNCPASITSIYLTQFPNTPPSGDTFFKYNTPGVSAGSSVRQTNDFTIPSDTPLGNWYLWVVAEPNPSGVSQMPRTDDYARSALLTVEAVVRQPNLIPQNVTLSTTQAKTNDQVAIMWTLTNASSVMCPGSLTGFRMGTSPTAVPPPANDLLNLRFPTPEISAFSVIRFTNIVTIPTNAAFGTNYIWVVADDDPNSTLNQSSRADDAARSPALAIVPVIRRPNLVPFDVTLNKDVVLTNTALTITWSTTNTGNANCPPSTTGFHLSTNATIVPTNVALVKISTPAINTNSFVRQTNSVIIPAGTTPGNYYLWVVADDTNNSTLDQSSRADDTARSSLFAVVSVIRQPNLVATNLTLSTQIAQRSNQVTAIWTILNTGNTNAASSQTGLRLGTNATVRPTNSVLNISISTPAIATNAPLRMTNTFIIPTNAPLGTNYIWVIADDTNNSTLNQSSRADDATVSGPLAIVTVLPQPNLVPLNVTLSSYSTRPNGPLMVTWTMTNSGTSTAAVSLTGLHLGTSASTTPTNKAFASLQTPALNANTSVRQTNSVTIPTNTTAGTYYLWVIADDVTNSTLNQISRADDATPSAALLITNSPVVTLISPAAAATVDAPATFEWTAPGLSNGKVYLAAQASPRLGVDKVVYFDNPAGTNRFRPASTNWSAAVTNLGFANNYYWTIGGPDPAHRETFADWRPFKTIPMPVSGSAISLSNGQFQFKIAAPNQDQVTIEASDTLTNWIEIITIPNVTGIVTYTDSSAPTRSRRFYRPQP